MPKRNETPTPTPTTPRTPPSISDDTPFVVGSLSSHRGEYATLAQYPKPTAVHLTSYGSVLRGRGSGVRAQIGESGQYVFLDPISRRNMATAGVKWMSDILGDWLIGPSPDGKTLVVLGHPESKKGKA